jgi:hypothetical protein
MEPSEEIRNLLQEMRDTQREHLALYKKFARHSQRALAIQRIALVLVFVGLIGLACLMVYLWSFFGFLVEH